VSQRRVVVEVVSQVVLQLDSLCLDVGKVDEESRAHVALESYDVNLTRRPGQRNDINVS